ncbi:MAG: NUDIX domain-containing protein [Microthrixaceae bacterium]
MPAFTKVSDVEVHRGFRFTVHQVRFRADDGTEFDRDVVRHPGAVAVVPLHEDGSVTLVRQFRAALDADLLEVPAGLRDVEGEADAHTAGRELVEEAGLSADHLELLVSFHNSPGFCDESVAVFLATGLAPVDHDPQGIEERHMTVERLTLDAALALIADGHITDAKTIIGLTLAAGRRAG